MQTMAIGALSPQVSVFSGLGGFGVVFQGSGAKKKSRQWTRLLILAALATTLGSSLPVGYNLGVINAPAEIIKGFCNSSIAGRYDVVLSAWGLDLVWSSVVSVFLVGGVTGSLTGSYFSDKLGRKGALHVSTLFNLLGALLFFIAKPCDLFEFLFLGRLCVGLAAGLITCVVPMYLIELSPLNIRGPMGVFCPLGITVGVLLGQILGLEQLLGKESTWPVLLSIYAPLVILSSMVVCILPESPKYLCVVKGKVQAAVEELARIRQMPEDELDEEIRGMNRVEIGESWNIAKTLRDKKLLLPILLVCFMQAGQQCSGINAVFYYSVSIFEKAGFNQTNSQLATIGAGCVNLVMCMVAIKLMASFDRRLLFQLSCLTASFWLVVLGLAIRYINSTVWMPFLCIAAVLLYVFCYQLGLGPIPYFVGSELFEVGPRPSAMALGSMANWGGNFLVGMSFPTMQNAIGPWSFFIFAAVTVALFFFIRCYFPETRNRDPSQVARLVSSGFASKPLDQNPSPTNTAETYSDTMTEPI